LQSLVTVTLVLKDPYCANPAMALAHYSPSSTIMKAVVLLLVVLLGIAITAAPGAAQEIHEATPVAKAAGGSRFSETPLGRKLLNLNLCGRGTAPNFNCAKILGPLAKNATCCTDLFGTSACFDVGAFYLDKCGSCNTRCPLFTTCCSGKCTNTLTDKNNCLLCGRKCPGNLPCQNGLCGY